MADDTIWQFTGDYRFLSNFWPAWVKLDGFMFPSVENAYQAAKFPNGIARSYFNTCTAVQAKLRGRTAKLPADWEERKLEVMRDLLQQKFEGDERLKQSLLATGDRLLIEGNNWGDRFWGVDLKTLEGENHLGMSLMQIRAWIRSLSGVTQ